MLQLIPNPSATLAEIARVLRPGGRMAIMVPTLGRAADLLALVPNGGVYFFAEDELGDTFEDLGLSACARRPSATSNGCAGGWP